MGVTPESFEHAKELLAEGKRDLLVHAVPDAVSNCSKACEIMAKHKGEMAAEYANAEKSLAAAVAVLNSRIANLKKMETSDNITKELADLTLLCTEIKDRTTDHKEMQKGTYKEENDFVSIFKGAEVHDIGTKKAVATA